MFGHGTYYDLFAAVIPAEIYSYELLGFYTVLDMKVCNVLSIAVSHGIVRLSYTQCFLAAALDFPVISFSI